MDINPNLTNGLIEFSEKNGMIAKDKQQNFSSHAVFTDILTMQKMSGVAKYEIQRCRVCEGASAELYDKPCPGLPPIRPFDDLGVF